MIRRRTPIDRQPFAHASPRRGVSLVELLAVMTGLSIVLGTSVVTLVRLLDAQSLANAALAESMTLARLAHDLRTDAHVATSARINTADGGAALILDGPEGETTYRSVGGRLTRSAPRSDGLDAREEYRLESVRAEFDLVESDRLVVVHLTGGAAPINAAARTLPHSPLSGTTIAAAVNLEGEPVGSAEAQPNANGP